MSLRHTAYFITTSQGLLSMGAGMLLKKLEEAPVTPPGGRPTHDVELGRPRVMVSAIVHSA